MQLAVAGACGHLNMWIASRDVSQGYLKVDAPCEMCVPFLSAEEGRGRYGVADDATACATACAAMQLRNFI